ncbi:MAG: WavE lipopolysaccharide synthesis family protein, partial [Desulfovibrionaceae bacterium]
MIHSKHISVILQGPVQQNITKQSIQSVRKYLPHAECILSTWEEEDTTALDTDTILRHKKPMAYKLSSHDNSPYNNVNLQILSTQKGLEKARGEYSLKLRTDFILSGNTFLQYFSQYEENDPQYTIFDKKILCPSYFTRNPRISFMYHPSDIAFFGCTKDIINLYNVPFLEEKDVTYYEYSGYLYNKFVPEQHIFIHCLLNNKHNITLQHSRDKDDMHIEQTERYFASNFVFLNWQQYNLLVPEKFKKGMSNDFISCVTHVEWQRLY